MEFPTSRNIVGESEARTAVLATGTCAANRFYLPASGNGGSFGYEHRGTSGQAGIVGYQLDWTYGQLPLAQYLLLKRWLQSPGYVAKATAGGTWKDDVTALRLIDG